MYVRKYKILLHINIDIRVFITLMVREVYIYLLLCGNAAYATWSDATGLRLVGDGATRSPPMEGASARSTRSGWWLAVHVVSVQAY